jgi:hypothetical protein
MSGKALEVIEKKTTALALAPELAAMFAEDAGTGFDNVKVGDYALPYLKVLQGISNEIQRGDPKQIPGAVAGDIFNSLTKQLYKGEVGLLVVFAAYDKKWIEWKPRKAGGGLVKISKSKAEAEQNRLPLVGNPDTDSYINETAEHYVLHQTPDGYYMPAVMSMSVTKLGVSRRLIGNMMQEMSAKYGIPGPNRVLHPSALVYRMTTETEKNKRNETYFVPKFEVVGPVTDVSLYRAAKDFAEQVQAGIAKVDYNEGAKPEEPVIDVEDDELPF